MSKRSTLIDEACDALQNILTGALDRLDKFGYPQLRGLEETSAGTCWEPHEATA